MNNNDMKEHIVEALNQGIRFDGRKLTEYREILVETGVAKNAEGSARVKIGETEVIVGVKLEVAEPYPDIPDEGTMSVGAELLPLSSSEFESGPPGIEAIELARVVDRGIRESNMIDTKKLCIVANEKVWMIAIDIITINDAGNLFDASALGAVAALQDTRFPEFDGEKIDYREKTKEKLPINKIPVSVTVCKVGDKFITDPITEEERVIDTRLTVATLKDGTVCAMQKGEDCVLTEEEIFSLIDIAIEKGKELRKHLE